MNKTDNTDPYAAAPKEGHKKSQGGK